VRYSFTVENTRGQPGGKASLWVFAPAVETAVQHCLDIETSDPAELLFDDMGNQVLRFDFEALPPYGARIFRVRANVAYATAPIEVPAAQAKRFLGPEPLIEADHADIVALAKTQRRATAAATAAATCEWIVANLADPGYTAEDKGALAALQGKAGDCSEQAYLFVALCRANVIPARYLGGCVLEQSRVLKPFQFHNWAEFHDGTTWRIADPNLRLFMDGDTSYLTLRIKPPDTAKDPLQGAHRFRLDGDGLQARMDAE